MSWLRQQFKQLLRHPSAVAGLVVIGGLLCLAIYAVLAIPYSEAIRLWRGGEGIWDDSPRNALPAWVNFWPGVNLPETIIVNAGSAAGKSEDAGGVKAVKVALPFDYQYDDFPSEVTIFFEAKFDQRRPQVSLLWLTPDNREIALGERGLSARERYSVSLDQRLTARFGGQTPEVGLFADPAAGEATVLKGRYELVANVLLFEEASDIDAKLVVYGKVSGVAGTDDRRRDLWLALLWGTPVALAFGLLAAAGSIFTTLIIAAIGVWYGRWVDAVIQRITELNAILPALPILILIGTFYSRSIWVMLGVIILLGIFSLGIKSYRAIFLQVRDLPYIEAARAYGAGNRRIIFRYMVPRIVPVLVPQFVLLIPSLVFLEAALAILGLGDPVLPTWGKVLNDAFQSGALYKGYYHTVLMPAFFLMLTGFGFAMLGYALDRIFNPRLRTE